MVAYGSVQTSLLMAEEGSVWPDDVEEALQEALILFPPCGRRKMLISDENKPLGEFLSLMQKMRLIRHPRSHQGGTNSLPDTSN